MPFLLVPLVCTLRDHQIMDVDTSADTIIQHTIVRKGSCCWKEIFCHMISEVPNGYLVLSTN